MCVIPKQHCARKGTAARAPLILRRNPHLAVERAQVETMMVTKVEYCFKSACVLFIRRNPISVQFVGTAGNNLQWQSVKQTGGRDRVETRNTERTGTAEDRWCTVDKTEPRRYVTGKSFHGKSRCDFLGKCVGYPHDFNSIKVLSWCGMHCLRRYY